MRKKLEGFTLIEMIVVLAVIAILAAILVPTIKKNINDAKVTRAQNETQVIAAAMVSFFKDLGRWPTSDGTSAADYLYLLYGPGNPASGVAYWRSDAGWSDDRKDRFENHLVENDPKDGAWDYPTTGDFAWRGPYLTQLKPDPWSDHYSCNVAYLWYAGGNTYAVMVLSAGPDRYFDTPVAQVKESAQIYDDDIGVRLQ